MHKYLAQNSFARSKSAIKNTGFDLIVPEKVPTTLPPTEDELKLLRTRVDRDGILRKFRLTAG